MQQGAIVTQSAFCGTARTIFNFCHAWCWSCSISTSCWLQYVTSSWPRIFSVFLRINLSGDDKRLRSVVAESLKWLKCCTHFKSRYTQNHRHTHAATNSVSKLHLHFGILLKCWHEWKYRALQSDHMPWKSSRKCKACWNMQLPGDMTLPKKCGILAFRVHVKHCKDVFVCGWLSYSKICNKVALKTFSSWVDFFFLCCAFNTGVTQSSDR